MGSEMCIRDRHSISNAGLMVTLSKRTPDEVCQAIERYELELLPTSPTFLQMLLIGRYYEKYNLSSLKIISYGTEPMPASTLARMHKLFPERKNGILSRIKLLCRKLPDIQKAVFVF